MKKLFIICSCVFLAANSCRKNETIGDPSFYLNLVISNPAQSFKLSLSIRPDLFSQRAGLMYLERVQGNSTIPYYRENGVLRRQMLDTVHIDQEGFQQFSILIRKSRVWEQGNSIGNRTDGNAYHFTLKDSSREHTFSLMGMSNNEYLQELTAFCLEQFNALYPQISILNMPSEIDLKKADRLTNKTNSLHIRVVKYGNEITAIKNGHSYSLAADQFIELWRVLENNHVWALESMTMFATKYPVEYRLSVRRDDLSCSFVVYAPSKLTDKRYFEVINAIEILKSADTNVHDYKR